MQLIAFLILLEIIVGGLSALPSKKYQQVRLYDKTSRNVMGESTDDTNQEKSSQSQDQTQASPTSENQPTDSKKDEQKSEEQKPTTEETPKENPTSPPQNSSSNSNEPTKQISQEAITVTEQQDQTKNNSQNTSEPTNTSSAETPQPSYQPESKSADINQVQIELTPTGEINTTPSQTAEESESINTEKNSQNAIQTDVSKSLETADSKIFSNVSQNNSAENLSNDTIGELNHEEEQLKNTTTPQDQVQLLTQFASNNIQNLHENLTTDNVDDMAFNAQRLTHQIDKSIDLIQSLDQQDATKFKNKIDTICKNAEYVLRPSQLAVTEDVEETLEITRGKCFNLEK